MNTRRAVLAGLAGSLITARETLAQVQEVTNVASVVATGDVTVEQDAAGSVTAEVGITRTPGGIQVVSNDGRVVATGDVHLGQRASGSMEVNVGVGDDVSADGICTPGEYGINDGVLFFCTTECLWRAFECRGGCKKGRC